MMTEAHWPGGAQGPEDARLARMFERLDWLRSAGCCGACAMNLALRSTAHPQMGLPCRQPLHNRGKCVEWARAAAEAESAGERKAA